MLAAPSTHVKDGDAVKSLSKAAKLAGLPMRGIPRLFGRGDPVCALSSRKKPRFGVDLLASGGPNR